MSKLVKGQQNKKVIKMNKDKIIEKMVQFVLILHYLEFQVQVKDTRLGS